MTTTTMKRVAAVLTVAFSLTCQPTASRAQVGDDVRPWYGIGVRLGATCECCGLVIPERFGLDDPRQLALLRELAGGEGRAVELGCFMAYQRQALRQLTALAARHQSRAAALIVLRADSEGGVDLGGGDLSEGVGGEFMVPVLEGFRAVKELLDKELSEHVARKVCASVLTGGDTDLSKLMVRLRGRSLAQFANLLDKSCESMSRGGG
jgi:hypothetical protein